MMNNSCNFALLKKHVERACPESLIEQEFWSLHSGSILGELKRRVFFSKAYKRLNWGWLAVSAARAAERPDALRMAAE